MWRGVWQTETSSVHLSTPAAAWPPWRARAPRCDGLTHSNSTTIYQWRRQRSKGARSFRGQKILKPGQVTQSPGRREGLAWPSSVANWEGGFLSFLFSFSPLSFPFSPLPRPSLPLEVAVLHLISLNILVSSADFMMLLLKYWYLHPNY